MSLSPELKGRVLGEVAQVPSPTLREAARFRAWASFGAVTASLAIFLARGGLRLTDRPWSLALLTCAGTALVAAVGAHRLMTRGGQMAGRSSRSLWFAAVGATATFVAWKLGVSQLYGHTAPWPTRPGFRCLVVSLSCGAPLLMAAVLVAGRMLPLRPAMTGAALGTGVGLMAAVLVDLWCPVAYLPHLLLGHVAPLVVLALAGAVLLPWWRARRASNLHAGQAQRSAPKDDRRP